MSSMDDEATLMLNIPLEAAYDTRVQIPSSTVASPQRQRRIRRVLPHLRRDKNQQVYDPSVLSLGPYHHGKPQYLPMEELKEEVLNMFVEESIWDNAAKDREFFYRKILERINEIRDHYDEVEFSDEALAEIILRDACFLIRFMVIDELFPAVKLLCSRFGLSIVIPMGQDMHLLENQVPFWVIKRLLHLRFGEDKAQKLLYEYLSEECFSDRNQLRGLPWDEKEDEPLHLLEALRTTFLKQESANETQTKPRSLSEMFKRRTKINSENPQIYVDSTDFAFRSVTYLQAKGIYFKPSSRCLRDIRFTSHSSYGLLQLPILFLSYRRTMLLISNMVTFELSPSDQIDMGMTSYVNFLKSLIESPKDVKVLQEKGILYSDLGNDEEIVKAFKEINTHGVNDYGAFVDVKRGIEKHCNSKAKTWMSELIHKYFRSPWTFIALFAAIFILCLTSLQTFFTIRPAK